MPFRAPVHINMLQPESDLRSASVQNDSPFKELRALILKALNFCSLKQFSFKIKIYTVIALLIRPEKNNYDFEKDELME